ncbi:hypothetical protein CCR75_000861 [Bremia lactucae]|uniref:Uncharacterized protein n=1 Tax=Bremia lactucae TaxID=4779 RepID=A0A976FP39_BRELC|nr:hypothetical protein CCR75_000861 [Bremia lactucae]
MCPCTFFRLQAKFGAAPVTTLRIVLDRVVSTQTNPLRNGTILFRFLCKNALRTESLVRRLKNHSMESHSSRQ